MQVNVISKARAHYVLRGMRWTIGDGNKINFWHQRWVSKEIIIADYITKPIPAELINKRVVDFVNVEGQWNWNMISTFIPNQILSKLQRSSPRLMANAKISYIELTKKRVGSHLNQLTFF